GEERPVIRTVADNQQPNRWMDLLDQLILTLLPVVAIGRFRSTTSTASGFLAKLCNDETNAPRGKIMSEITQEVFGDRLDEDVDFACTTKTSARVETYDCWLTGLEDFTRAQRHFIFQTSRAK